MTRSFLSWKNIVFNFLFILGLVYLQINDRIFNFFLDDSSRISICLLALYPLVIVRYSFGRIGTDWMLARLTRLYGRMASVMGAVGTVLGMYVIFKDLSVMQVDAENLQQVLKVVTNGIFIDLIPTATGLFITGLILVNKFLYGGDIEGV